MEPFALPPISVKFKSLVWISLLHVHMPAHKVMMTAKHKMGSAAVRSFLTSMWKMGNGHKNWEEEGKSLVKKNKKRGSSKARDSGKKIK